MRRSDYNDGRDPVSGELITIVRDDARDLHFTDVQPNTYFADQAERALTAEERFERHRDAKLAAAIGTLATLMEEARTGNGRAASACVQAASADLIITMLAGLLKAAREKLSPDDSLALRIDTALTAAGAR